MSKMQFIHWIDDTFSSLPISKEDFFQQLWQKGKLTYMDSPELVDSIDENNAKIICTALEKRKLSLIVLPDNEVHRGALMFGSALLKSAIECIQEQVGNNKVLYFGTAIGFKYSLSRTAIGNLQLDNVFTYSQASGRYDKYKNYRKSDPMGDYLPEVICVYHPGNPEEFVQIYNPDWVAIDCGKDIEVDWLEDLLKYCEKKHKPVIAWCQNRFSKVIDLFEQYKGQIYYSPNITRNGGKLSIGELFINRGQCVVEPITFEKDRIDEIDTALDQAKGILRGLSISGIGSLEKDAIRTSWIFLRTLERLSLPVAIYNAEAKSFKYVYSLNSLDKTLAKYSDFISSTNPNFVSKIEEFRKIAKSISTAFETSEPPYWSALSNYCMDRAPEGFIRALIFPKRHQKQLFTYTLLSRFNIREDELFDDSRIILRTLKEITSPNNSDRFQFDGQAIIPIVAGLPDYYNRHLFYHLINKWPTKVLIYPHQTRVLKAILKDFNELEAKQFVRSIQALSTLTDNSRKIDVPDYEERYQLANVTEIEIDYCKTSDSTPASGQALVDIGDLNTELAQLLETGDQDEEDVEYLMNINVATKEEDESLVDDGLLIENAVEILFQGSYRLIVDPKEQVNVVRQGKVEKTFVRALRTSEKILFIENQSRQGLYDLIIGRVHNHPSLELHLGMLRKWKEDFHLGYTKWKEDNPSWGLWEFLQILKEKGSGITTALTVNNWVNGYVMRPQDPEDLRRIGEILDLKFLKENYTKVYNAASRIVGIHISLSRKLNDWLENRASNYQRDDMELIDDELGLTFGE